MSQKNIFFSTATMVATLIVMAAYSPSANATNPIGIYATPNDEVLNSIQRRFLEFYEDKFVVALDRSYYSEMPERTRRNLERLWINELKDFEGKDTPALREAISVLTALRSKSAIPHLINIANENVDKSNRARWMAIRAIGLIGDVDHVPALIPLTYHYNMNTRIWAQISLCRLTNENFGYDWEEWGKWWNGRKKSAKQIESESVEWVLNTDYRGRIPGSPFSAEELLDPNIQRKMDIQYYTTISI
ncbi:MAG: hypothetical protein NXI22_22505, partial [bacterium]|nr:hypothetical protein [bacterium]